MAIVVTREKESESLTSLDVPYYVADSAIAIGSQLSRTSAITAAGAQGLIDQGDAANDYEFTRLAYNVARVVLRYRTHDLSPLPQPTQPETGSVEFGFSGQSFNAEHRIDSLRQIASAKLPGITTTPPNFKGLVNVQFEDGKNVVRGYNLQLPPETDYINYIIPNASFTSAYRAIVSSLLFKVHGADDDTAEGAVDTFFGFEPGEVMLVRAQARSRGSDDLQLSFGFSVELNGPRIIFDGPTSDYTPPLNNIHGHDYGWGYLNEEMVDDGFGNLFAAPFAMYYYVNRIWRRGDLNLLGLPGSAPPP